jgi:hypothetical protein
MAHELTTHADGRVEFAYLQPWSDFNPDLFLTLDGRRLFDVFAS